MKQLITIVTILVFTNQIKAQQVPVIDKSSPFTIGESIQFKSEILNETRTINVYLPTDYVIDSIKKYPVIYLLDGSADEDFIHIAGLVQFASFSWINIIPETIVVGIANIDRKRDFTYPTNNQKDKIEFPTTGSSANFMKFIEREVQPLIENKFRTDSTKTLIGQSLGGLLATEILFKHPTLFDNYIIISPSLWWDDESLLKINPKDLSAVKSVYIGVGDEGKIMKRVAKELYQKIKPLSNNNKLYYNFFENKNHGDALHLAVYDSFEKLFKNKNL